MSDSATEVADGSRLAAGSECDRKPPWGNTGVTNTQYGPNCPEPATDDVTDEHWRSEGRYAAFESQTSELAARPGALLLDYLRVRLDDTDEVRGELPGWLGEMTVRQFGWRSWYDQSWAVLDGGIVAACSERHKAAVQGLLVDLPGRACAGLGERLPAFLGWCLRHGKVTRADFALDDRQGLVTYERIAAAVNDGTLVKRSSKDPQLTAGMSPGGFVGWTVYIGARSSAAMVRIYDKAAEQGVAGPWVRVELEVHKELADLLCWQYEAKGSEVVVGELNRHLHFAVKVEGDTNRSRWPWAPWWAELVGSIRPGPSLLAGEKPVHTVERAKTWIETQVAPNFALVLASRRWPLFVQELRRSGEERFTAKHYAALAARFAPADAGAAG